MFVLIVGGGRIGSQLASSLVERGADVAVIEKDEARAEALRASLSGVTVIHGDGDEPVVLEAAHISRAQAVAAMTDEDEDNLVACLLARREYGVEMTVGRVNNPRNEWLYGERFGVDEAIAEDALDPSHLAGRLVTPMR